MDGSISPWSHLQDGRPRRALSALDQAGELAGQATAIHRSWWLEIEARIALGDDRPGETLRLYRALGQLAESSFDPNGRWRSAVGRTRAQQAAGDRQPAADDRRALAALAEAEDLLDETSLRIPFHEGRETFVARREAATCLYLDLLLASGRCCSRAASTGARARG